MSRAPALQLEVFQLLARHHRSTNGRLGAGLLPGSVYHQLGLFGTEAQVLCHQVLRELQAVGLVRQEPNQPGGRWSITDEGLADLRGRHDRAPEPAEEPMEPISAVMERVPPLEGLEELHEALRAGIGAQGPYSGTRGSMRGPRWGRGEGSATHHATPPPPPADEPNVARTWVTTENAPAGCARVHVTVALRLTSLENDRPYSRSLLAGALENEARRIRQGGTLTGLAGLLEEQRHA